MTTELKPCPIDLVPLLITGYACPLCHKWHRKPSKPFFAHYDAFKHSLAERNHRADEKGGK